MADTVNTMLEQSPLPRLIEGLAVAIANAQLQMDKHSIEIAKAMGDPRQGVQFAGTRMRSMLELGFTPSFYHFSETTIRARVAFSSAESNEFAFGASIGAGYYGIFTASVNASYSNKYSFSAEGSSEINTRIVSLPPPAALTQLISDSIARNTA